MSRYCYYSLFTYCVLIAGCAEKPASPAIPQSVPNTPAITSQPGVPGATGANADLSIPRLDPKPVIWLADLKEDPPLSAARAKARQLMSLADRLKAGGRFEDAEAKYKESIAADPTWAFPAYQLACNYELWNQPARALPQFTKAMELGFDDFPSALADEELGQIRTRPDFNTALQGIRQRYLASSKSRVGQPVAVRPQGTKPETGWPMMLLLHGYGDSNLSYLDQAAEWAGQGFLTVAVPGSVPTSDGRFQWDMDSTDPTQRDLQAIVTSPLFNGLVDKDKVFLLGFSQGALHAMLLTAAHPNLYAGVVSLSPGGSLSTQLIEPKLNRSERPASVVFIHGTQERHAPLVGIWSQACQAAGWRFLSKTHPGRHHFPADWEKIQPEIAAFLRNSKP
ncbi:MAG: tetratricopeptide repeat protein [Planctomycetaceae bacterium]|nr:tetratricopeptide repeat protein [Planctomycetaceae bacterium]